jgi:5-formyltetrahydrofolate cyclo-ligase
MSKEQIRLRMKKERNSMTLEERLLLNPNIDYRLYQTIQYRACTKLFAYLSMGSEVDTWHIICKALKEHKSVFLPRVEGTRMNFYQVFDLDNLVKSKFGIYEPPLEDINRYELPIEDLFPVNSSISETLQHNLMLLPGLAFDMEGNRIGYGAGYYDRYLAQYPEQHFYKIGIAYDLQLVNSCEAKDYDAKVHEILTPTQRIVCNRS